MVTTPGVGTTGTITYQGGADSNRLGVRDYAANSPAGTPQFILNPPDRLQTTSEISFPFDYRNEPDLEDMRLAAQQQGNYYQLAAGTSASITGPGGVGTGPKWPNNSAVDTVVFVRFASWDSHNSLTWNVSGNCRDAVPMKGTLVVENGTFTAGGQNNARLNGYVIIRGVPVGIESFTSTGNCGMEGAVNSSGNIRIAGTVEPFTLESGNRPGFYSLRRWSWRELFQ
jgi:hypothetical protein